MRSRDYIAFGLLTTGPLLAQGAGKGFEGEPFGLRFPATLTRFSRYPDLAGSGGAYVAARFGSSSNPAAIGLAWMTERGASVQYDVIDFEAGTRIDVVSASYTGENPAGVWWQPSIGYASSNRATTQQGLGFQYSVAFFELQIANMTGPETAFGVNLNFADSELEFDAGPFTASKSEGQTYGIRIGGMYEPGHRRDHDVPAEEVEKGIAEGHDPRPYDFWRFGAALDYAVTPSTTTMFDLGMGGGDMTIKDTGHQFYVRTGAAFVYAPASRLYLDYQFAHFTDDSGDLSVNRFYAGIDHELALWFGARAGTAIDAHGNVAVTAGLIFVPSSSVYIDMAYQYAMFPEVEEEFGTAQLFGIAFGVTF